MKIGIDISQTAFEGTGVGNYVYQLVTSLIEQDKENDYILFFSSMRRPFPVNRFAFANNNKHVTIKKFRFPPTLLDLLWNRLHILPVELLIGDIDVFIASDWTQPPLQKAKGISILYDLIVYTFPEEMADKIVKTHKRRLHWVKKECSKIICISESTKKDAKEILGIEDERLEVIYPGIE